MSNEEHRFVAFVEARQSSLLTYAYMLTGSRADAEDTVQTALIRCLPLWGGLRAETTEAYVRKVIARLAWQRSRRPWAHHAGLDDLTVAAPAGVDTAELVDLRDALSQLPTDQRVVLVLRYWQDMTEGEVAETLGCRVGTVKSRTARAVAALRHRLAVTDQEPAGRTTT